MHVGRHHQYRRVGADIHFQRVGTLHPWTPLVCGVERVGHSHDDLCDS